MVVPKSEYDQEIPQSHTRERSGSVVECLTRD